MKKITLCAALAAATFAFQPAFAEDKADPSLDKTGRGGAVDRAGHKTDTLNNRDRDAAAADRAVSDVDAARPAAAREAGSSADAKSGGKDRMFVMKAAQGGMYEVQAAKVAQERASSNEIKQLAQMIERDHQQANQQLMQIAQSKGFDVPKELDAVHQAKLQALQKLQGEDFEQMYLYDQVAGHVKMSLKFRDASTKLQDPQLKQFAMTTLQSINQHGQHAARQANWTGFGNDAQPAGDVQRGTGTGAAAPSGSPSSERGQTSGATSGAQGPVGPSGAGDTGSTPQNK